MKRENKHLRNYIEDQLEDLKKQIMYEYSVENKEMDVDFTYQM